MIYKKTITLDQLINALNNLKDVYPGETIVDIASDEEMNSVGPVALLESEGILEIGEEKMFDTGQTTIILWPSTSEPYNDRYGREFGEPTSVAG